MAPVFEHLIHAWCTRGIGVDLGTGKVAHGGLEPHEIRLMRAVCSSRTVRHGSEGEESNLQCLTAQGYEPCQHPLLVLA